MDTLDLRSSPSPMEGVVSSNDENIKDPSSSSKCKYQMYKECYMVENDGGEEEEDEEDEDDEFDAEDEEDDDQEFFEQSQDEESSESPSNKPSSSTACSRKSKSSLTKSSDVPGPSSSIAPLKKSDHHGPSNTQPSKNEVDENKAHQIRLKNLRKHLDYIEQTNWMYTPIEELIGLSDSSKK